MGEDVLGAFAVWQCKAWTRRKKERKRENLKFVIRSFCTFHIERIE
jgi:hypothetical protein